ncbi:MAG: sel1 repeat family protein [Proteobacteria bacterium]|nr:sel1 repeat family protein [Pseudomonadota bacterium]
MFHSMGNSPIQPVLRHATRCLIFLACLLACTSAWALDPPAEPAHPAAAASGDFLYYHPDLSGRHDGLLAYSRHDYAYALKAFMRGARFADKGSQAMVASMYWDGLGTAKDHATAYAWADLAAERGYPWLLATRERYWQQMTADERQRAIAIGQSLYAEYGDAVAQPRLETWLRRGSKQATGSHTGFVGTLETFRGDGFGTSVTGEDGNGYYADRFWKPAQYWGAQAKAWNPGATGKVTVGPLEKADAPASPTDDPAKH